MKTIVVALDTSEVATQVLEEAAAHARRAGARLIVLRVVGVPVGVPASLLAAPEVELSAILQKNAREDLEARVAGLPREIARELRVELGTPWQGICAVAEETAADLIVIGSHGLGVLDRLLGTTAARVVNHAHTSVLVVKPKLNHPK